MNSIVVTQALTLLNSRFVETSAQAFAQRVLRTAKPNRQARLELAFELAFARTPRGPERRAVGEFLDAVQKSRVKDKDSQADATAGQGSVSDEDAAATAAWTQLAIVLLTAGPGAQAARRRHAVCRPAL